MASEPPTVVAIGELLWDVFPDGPRFGGAPINFAHHAAALGADTWVITAVGDDDLGRQALQRLRQANLVADHVAVHHDLPTGAVRVSIDDRGVPTYRFNECDAWDDLRWSEALGLLARRCQAVCFGTLGQRDERSRQTIQRFVGSTNADCWRVLDLNLRPPFFDDQIIEQSLRLANVLKLNEEELAKVTEQFQLGAETEAAQLPEIAAAFDLELVAVTKGDQGSLMFRGGQTSRQTAQPTEVIDTVGAGDAFTAALVTGLIAETELDSINQQACRLAEQICAQSGAV